MLVSIIACSSPTEQKQPKPEPAPYVDPFVSEHVTTKTLSTGIEFTIEKKAEDSHIYQIFITENDVIHLQLNENVSEKITELNTKGTIKFVFPFTEAEKESTFNIWFNCGNNVYHDADITVKATGGLVKATEFYDKEEFDKIGLSIKDANKSKSLFLSLPSGTKNFDSFITDDSVFTADALNFYHQQK